MSRTKNRSIVLGWKITNKEQNPDYWMTPTPSPGNQKPDQLIAVKEEAIRTNTIIVASQGSGKSFFLGRLIEEILLRTDSRVLCFDPNSDFIRVHSTVRGTMWTKADYNPRKSKAQPLPHEENRLVFKRPWDRIAKRVYSASKHPPPKSVPISLDWLDYKVEWLSEGTALPAENELYSCHRFVGEIKQLFAKAKTIEWRADHELLEFARDTWFATEDRTTVAAKLKEQFAFDAEGSSYQTRQCPLPRGSTVKDFDELLAIHIRAAAKHRPFISEGAQRNYFGIGQAIKRSGIFSAQYPLRNEPGTTAHFVDLLSIPEMRYKLMVVLKYVEDEIRNATELHQKVLATQGKKGAKDPRKPLFIVADEAHNLMPAEPETKLARDVRNKFRWIASEGRKFGIFLILVTQEPAKVDRRILSACENKAVMKLAAGEFLKQAVKAIGLGKEDAAQAERASGFLQGRALLFGKWANNSFSFLYGAMRRTFPGGSGIPDAK